MDEATSWRYRAPHRRRKGAISYRNQRGSIRYVPLRRSDLIDYLVEMSDEVLAHDDDVFRYMTDFDLIRTAVDLTERDERTRRGEYDWELMRSN